MSHVWPIPKIEHVAFSELTEERSVALIYSRAAYDAVKSRLGGLRPAWEAEAREASIEHWESLAAAAQGDLVYSVGGGLAVDAAKFVAAKKNLPLVCLPTALTVDAFLTWASGYRHNGTVRYMETKPPDRLIVDFEILGGAPASLRAAGVCDVLSIATGAWDWHYADRRGLNPPHAPYIQYVADAARAILDGALDCAEAAGRGDAGGLKQLLDCLALEVQLCNLIGHSRPEEGSEHYFAYAVENAMGKGLAHGDLVGPGIVIMAGLQGLDVRPLRRALIACNVPLGNIPPETILGTLRSLPQYCRRHQFAHGLAHDLTPEMVAHSVDFI